MPRTLFVNLLVALAATAAGFALYRLVLEPRTRVPPPALTPLPSTPSLPAIRAIESLPDFSLADRSGTRVSIRSWPGKSLIVNFWATWCAPCRKEIPLLMQTQKARAQDGFQVVGVAVDEREQVLRYADEIQLDYPLLIGEQDALDALASFGIEAAVFPVTAFTDAQARIVAVYPGELTSDKLEVILGGVDRVNRGEQTPSQARATVTAGLEQLHAH